MLIFECLNECFHSSLIKNSKLVRLELAPDIVLLLSYEIKPVTALSTFENLEEYKTATFFIEFLDIDNMVDDIDRCFTVVIDGDLFVNRAFLCHIVS